MAEKPSRKQLREPDEFISFTQRVFQWINEKQKLLIASGLVAVVAVLAVYSWNWYLESSARRSSAAFVEVSEILDAKVVPPVEEGDVPPVGAYASEEEKYRAALTGLNEVLENHSNSATTSLATYFVGECQRKLGEHDEAVAAFEEYLRTEGPSGTLAPFAIEGIAATLEDKGENDQARQQYLRLTEEPFESQRARGLYHLARMDQKLGKPDAAVRKFKALLKECPDTQYVREIQDRLAMLPEVEEPEDSGEGESPGAGKDESDESEKSDKTDNDSKKAG